ncbi:hypothetical protein OESDEN_04855 [Oesophagostomum dentatum]|uniref:Uncharacterized protein n=1 Tax=Oesophagostomum dentatum TaxID=61180 RepID=A0A0B1TIJ2_OESDE|nr:hypothetical protein OESDEN_04855 [Oesophagostomum dentatum]
MVEFLDVPHPLVIAVNINWQLSHGLHGLVYLRFNTQVRKEVFALFRKPKTRSAVSMMHTPATLSGKIACSKNSV